MLYVCLSSLLRINGLDEKSALLCTCPLICTSSKANWCSLSRQFMAVSQTCSDCIVLIAVHHRTNSCSTMPSNVQLNENKTLRSRICSFKQTLLREWCLRFIPRWQGSVYLHFASPSALFKFGKHLF